MRANVLLFDYQFSTEGAEFRRVDDANSGFLYPLVRHRDSVRSGTNGSAHLAEEIGNDDTERLD